jgi:hypothetical protein
MELPLFGDVPVICIILAAVALGLLIFVFHVPLATLSHWLVRKLFPGYIERQRAKQAAREKALAELRAQEERRRAEEWRKREEKELKRLKEERDRAAIIADWKRNAKEVKLAEVISDRVAEVVASGAGLTSVTVKLTSLVEQPLAVEIPRGSVFMCLNTAAQNMITTRDVRTELWPKHQVKTDIEAACINKRRSIPSAFDRFQLVPADQLPLFGLGRLRPDSLVRLLDSSAFWQYSVLVRQSAIWTLTDNPSQMEIEDFILTNLLTINDKTELRGGRPVNYFRDAYQGTIQREMRNLGELLEKAGITASDLASEQGPTVPGAGTIEYLLKGNRLNR